MPLFAINDVAALNTQNDVNATRSSLNMGLQPLSSELKTNTGEDGADALPIAGLNEGQVMGPNAATLNMAATVNVAQMGPLVRLSSHLASLHISSAGGFPSATIPRVAAIKAYAENQEAEEEE